MQYTMEELDRMEGHEFEYACAELLRHAGYRDVTVTQGAGDYGIDILARRGTVRYAVQCKRYNSNVSVKAVQEAGIGCDYYHCDAAAVMTNSNFTKQAINLAQTTGVRLWDRSFLYELIDSYDEEYDIISPPIAVRHGKGRYDSKENKTAKVNLEVNGGENIKEVAGRRFTDPNNTNINRGMKKDIVKKTVPENQTVHNTKCAKQKKKTTGQCLNAEVKKAIRIIFDIMRWILFPIILLIFVVATITNGGYFAAVFGIIMSYLVCPLNRKFDKYFRMSMWTKVLLFWFVFIGWCIAFGMTPT